MNFKPDNKGISLALTIGLLLLLVTITTTVNELVLRALRASHQIEASDKAYFAAEAGVENALYELSAHTAGYQTDALGVTNVRNDDFSDTSVSWNNEWEIASRNLNDCNAMDSWEDGYLPEFCGRIREGEKLVINLFTDDPSPSGILTNQVSEAGVSVTTLDVSQLEIKFRLPISVVENNPLAFSGLPPLRIDNDKDYNTSDGSGLNEDGLEIYDPANFAPAPCPSAPGLDVDDNDCDGREDEDSLQDPVILWKLLDDDGHTFQPLRGCKLDANYPSHPAQANANICESSFRETNFEVSASFSETELGIDQDGATVSLAAFLSGVYSSGTTNALQLEILAVAPFEAIDVSDQSKINIPYLEYGMTFTADTPIPATFFAIKSDGYYQDFKQSITTNVVPRASTRLLDLTIIQQ